MVAMKKIYMTPKSKVYNIRRPRILSGSGGSDRNLMYNRMRPDDDNYDDNNF